MIDDFFFTWEGANDPAGPWAHMKVLELRGTEAIGRPYQFEIELLLPTGAADVDVADLIGQRAALRIATLTDPPFRLVHGIIGAAEELGEVQNGSRFSVTLVPPIARAAMMKKSIIHLGKTLREIIETTLMRSALGAGLVRSSSSGSDLDDGDPMVFTPAVATFEWRAVDTSRIDDPQARPYCVQYCESDFDFVSRLLEEEGIGYHFEHTKSECILVLADFDGGRFEIDPTNPLGPGIAGREIERVRAGTRLRPRSVALHDFNWTKPDLDLLAKSTSGVTDFATIEYPGRFEHSRQTGETLATVREQRLDTERAFVRASGRCRLLGAGTVFHLEHPSTRMSGAHIVTAIRHDARQRGSFGNTTPQDPYICEIECVRRVAGPGGTSFRPARITPRPYIHGSQTAIVTAEPSAPDAEINVGGPANIGCVRVRFHWDIDVDRLEKEPSSCWVRVSQMFAGAGHGAMWHPRVGDEVIVEFIDGDPDRPIVTGRVYNGANLSPENATARPTYSTIKSLTSPRDGTFNMIAFEDELGKQEISIVASRNYSTSVANDQSTNVTGSQSTSAGSISHSSGSTITMSAATEFKMSAGTTMSQTAPLISINGGSYVGVGAPWISIVGDTDVRAEAPNVAVQGRTTLKLEGNSQLFANGSSINIEGYSKALVRAPDLGLNGTSILKVDGPTILITGGDVLVSGNVTVKGGNILVEGGAVDIKGGSINLN